MKPSTFLRSVPLFALALAGAPAVSLAQSAAQSANGNPDAPSPALRAAMEQTHAQMRQLRQQTRTQMLGALTPAHRTLVANIVGALAVAPNPNPQAAAQQIDVALSGNEKQTVVNLAAASRANARNLMTAARSRFTASLSADERARMAQAEARRAAEPAQPAQTDPGAILLRTLGEGTHGPGGPGEFGGPHDGPPPGR